MAYNGYRNLPDYPGTVRHGIAITIIGYNEEHSSPTSSGSRGSSVDLVAHLEKLFGRHPILNSSIPWNHYSGRGYYGRRHATML